MTVYFLDTGDVFPETLDFVRQMTKDVPHFVSVPGRVHEAISTFGPPSDLVDYRSSEVAWGMGVGGPYRLQDRLMCCARGKMIPLHNRMIADGITLVIRGQRKAEEFKGPLTSGDVSGDIEFLYPIEDWTEEETFNFLREHGVEPPLYGHGFDRSGDCMTCSAWLGDNRAEYLAKNHPKKFLQYGVRISVCGRATEHAIVERQAELTKLSAAVAHFKTE